MTVIETGGPGGAKIIGASIHVSYKEFCNGEGDEPTTGETVGFDGKETDTLTYPHGTKVTIVKDGDKIKITVVFPDSTTDSLEVK